MEKSLVDLSQTGSDETLEEVDRSSLCKGFRQSLRPSPFCTVSVYLGGRVLRGSLQEVSDFTTSSGEVVRSQRLEGPYSDLILFLRKDLNNSTS